jgi:hypothetical protein
VLVLFFGAGLTVVLSLDVMDASGEVQTDVASTMFKTRLDGEGNVIDTAKMDVGFNYEPPPDGYCGPCYGGKAPNADGCCNTCQDVRDAYQANGWAINDYSGIEQCVREQYTLLVFVIDGSYKENLLSQSHEGCNLAGFIRVNKVAGNFHVAPGRSFAINGMHVHDTVSPRSLSTNVRRNISIKKMAQGNIIQAMSSMTSASVPISMKLNLKVQKNGAIPSKTPKSTPMTVLPTHADN